MSHQPSVYHSRIRESLSSTMLLRGGAARMQLCLSRTQSSAGLQLLSRSLC